MTAGWNAYGSRMRWPPSKRSQIGQAAHGQQRSEDDPADHRDQGEVRMKRNPVQRNVRLGLRTVKSKSPRISPYFAAAMCRGPASASRSTHPAVGYVGADEVEEGDRKVRLDPLFRILLHLAGLERQFEHADGERDRRVLEDVHELEVSGGGDACNAMGGRTYRYVCGSVNPIASPAWRLPAGEALDSRTHLLRDPGGGEQAQADRGGEELLGRHVLLDPHREAAGEELGHHEEPQEHLDQQGNVRNSSTYPVQRRTTQRVGAVRSVPIRKPRTRAITQEERETDTVHPRPVIGQERYVSSPALDLFEVDAPSSSGSSSRPRPCPLKEKRAGGDAPLPLRCAYFFLLNASAGASLGFLMGSFSVSLIGKFMLMFSA